MLVSPCTRLTCASIRNFKIIRSSLNCALKNYVILSPTLNPGTRGVYFSLPRHCGTKFDPPDVFDECLDKDESVYLYQKLSRKENIARLMECTGCSESLASSMLKEFPKLRYISSIEISRKINFLSGKGVSSENILKNYWLLTLQIGEMEEKLNILAKLGVGNNNIAVPLLQIPLENLNDTAIWSQKIVESNKTKIEILCGKLKCDPAEIALAVSVHKFLKSVPFDRMNTILDILLGEGVPPSSILRDMWVFRYRVEKVQARVNLTREGRVEQFKTWMVRCTEKILSNTIRLQTEKKALLGPHNDSTVEYISSRLNVNKAEAQLIFSRQPQLRGVGAAKLRNTFDFLIGKEGRDPVNADTDSTNGDEDMGPKFDRVQVWNSSRILCHSLGTMKSRLARLRKLGYEPKNPVLLYKSKRKFEEFMQKLQEKRESLAEKSEETAKIERTIKERSKSSQRDLS